jgi:peptidoglycan hydrolase-like protein with peptidoglycan-binding domain
VAPPAPQRQPVRQDQAGPAYPRVQVAETQRLLAQLGFDPGPVDGAMGPRTTQAIRRFEVMVGLPTTGAPNDAVLAQLRVAAGGAGAIAATSTRAVELRRAAAPTP